MTSPATQLSLFSLFPVKVVRGVEVRHLPARGKGVDATGLANSRSEAVREALERIRYEQDAVVGRAGLGWRYGNDVNEHGHRMIELDVEELQTVHRIHDLRAEGLSFRRIAEVLEREGHRTKRGGAWHASTVRSVLQRGGRLSL